MGRKILRGLKLFALGVLALVSLALVWLAVANWQANRSLAAKIEDLRERNLPTSLADLARTPPPPDKNAATYLLRAKDTLDEIVAAVDKVCHAAGDTNADSTQYELLMTGTPSPDVLQGVREALASNPEGLSLIEQASRCPDCDWQFDYSGKTMPEAGDAWALDNVTGITSTKRQAFRVLRFQTAVLLAEQKPQQALEVCHTMLRLHRLFAGDPLLLNYLVSSAIYSLVTTESLNQVLRAGTFSAEDHARLEETLSADDLAANFRNALVTERAYSLEAFDEMRGLRALLLMSRMPWFTNDNLAMADLFDTVADSTSRPYDEKLRAELENYQDGGTFTVLTLPAMSASRATFARQLAAQRTARVLNRLVELDPGGEKNLALDQLNLPADVLIDPYDGQPLRHKYTPNGWLVYSVGKNLQDDGGTLVDRKDEGLGPVAKTSGPAPANP